MLLTIISFRVKGHGLLAGVEIHTRKTELVTELEGVVFIRVFRRLGHEFSRGIIGFVISINSQSSLIYY